MSSVQTELGGKGGATVSLEDLTRLFEIRLDASAVDVLGFLGTDAALRQLERQVAAGLWVPRWRPTVALILLQVLSEMSVSDRRERDKVRAVLDDRMRRDPIAALAVREMREKEVVPFASGVDGWIGVWFDAMWNPRINPPSKTGEPEPQLGHTPPEVEAISMRLSPEDERAPLPQSQDRQPDHLGERPGGREGDRREDRQAAGWLGRWQAAVRDLPTTVTAMRAMPVLIGLILGILYFNAKPNVGDMALDSPAAEAGLSSGLEGAAVGGEIREPGMAPTDEGGTGPMGLPGEVMNR